MPGILSSQIGTVDGSEIVRVQFDSNRTGLPQLVRALKDNSSFYSVIAKDEGERDRFLQSVKKSDISLHAAEPHFTESKYSLRSVHPELYFLDLTESQAIALNAWSYFGGSMPDVLSAEQKKTLPILKEKLRHSRPPFHPERQGKGLEDYTRMLQDWLSR